MKKAVFLLIGILFAATMAFAQGNEAPAMPPIPPIESGEVAVPEAPMAPPAPAEEVLTITGDIIDNMCADANKEKLEDFVKTHTKECATMPMCAASGYSIYSNGNLMKFNTESNLKIEEFLRKPESKLQVVIEAKKTGDILSLVSINNQ